MQRDKQALIEAVDRVIDERTAKEALEKAQADGFLGTAAGMASVIDWIFPPRGLQENCEGVPPRAGQEDK